MSIPVVELGIGYYRFWYTKGSYVLVQNYADLYLNRVFKLFVDQSIKCVDINWVYENYSVLGIFKEDHEYAKSVIGKAYRTELYKQASYVDTIFSQEPLLSFKSKEERRIISHYFLLVLKNSITTFVGPVVESKGRPRRYTPILEKDLVCSLLSIPQCLEVVRPYCSYNSNWTLNFKPMAPPPLPESLDPEFIGAKNRLIKVTEDRYREMFVSERDNPESPIQDLYVNCIKVFENESQFVYQSLEQDEKKINQLLCKNRFLIEDEKSSIVGSGQFTFNWYSLTMFMFNNLNWNNLFVAGGCVLGCLLHSFQPSTEEEPGRIGYNGFHESDIDVFMYGLNDEEASLKIDHIISIIETNIAKPPVVMRSQHAVTICNVFPFRNVQIILRLYKSPAEVLMGFDVDCCCVGYDGTNVWAIPRSQRAINKCYNLVDMSRRSLTYERRLLKYSKRGWSVMIPGFDRDLVNISHSQKTSDSAVPEGLCKLLYFDWKEKRFDMYNRVKYYYNSIKYIIETNASIKKKHLRSLTDYGTPESRGFYFQQELDELVNKKKINLPDGTTLEIGTKSILKSKTIPLEFVKENPGKQLLTGSFHPISNNKWYQDAFHDKGLCLQGRIRENSLNKNEGPNFVDFYKEEESSDVVFVVGPEKRTFKSHKFILSSVSSTFKAQFFGSLKIPNNSTVEIVDVTVQAFEAMLEFIYTQKVSNLENLDATDLLFAAKKYDLKALAAHCSQYLLENLNVDNVLGLFSQSYYLDEKFILSQCQKLIGQNLIELIKSPSFLELDSELLRSILITETTVENGTKLYDAVIKWTKRQCELQSKDTTKKNIRQILKDTNILPLIKIDLVDTDKITEMNIYKKKEKNQSSPPLKRPMTKKVEEGTD